jgi:hypothetical protein
MSRFSTLLHRIADRVLGPIARVAMIATDRDFMLGAEPSTVARK